MTKKKLKPEDIPLEAAKKSVLRLKKRLLKRGEGDDLLIANLCDQALRLHSLIAFDKVINTYEVRADVGRRKFLKM